MVLTLPREAIHYIVYLRCATQAFEERPLSRRDLTSEEIFCSVKDCIKKGHSRFCNLA
jgi:hypothetical protein